jgi:chaperonin GroEL (HSP60 family)
LIFGYYLELDVCDLELSLKELTMSKIIKSGFAAKQAIKNGVDIAANAIKVTLGPTGKAVILDKSFGSPTITDDGVTVAKDIELEDKFENVGASLIQEVANKTNEEAGDGTTTATVLAQKMIEKAFEAAALASSHANDIKRGMDKAVEFVVEELKKVRKEVKTKEEVEVWALLGHGAAHTLREILTIKSDDILGRSAAFDAIVKGEEITQSNAPASFNVLLNNLRGLALDVELKGDNGMQFEETDSKRSQTRNSGDR